MREETREYRSDSGEGETVVRGRLERTGATVMWEREERT